MTGTPETGIHPQTPQSWGHQEALGSGSAIITRSLAVVGFPAPQLRLEQGHCRLELPRTQPSATAFIPSAVLCCPDIQSVIKSSKLLIFLLFFLQLE